MNEKTWARILEWEALFDQNNHNDTSSTDSPPKLSRFIGKPSDLSPKARIKNLFFSHPLPFDRHDWTIVRSDGTEVRYVIDYYHDESRASEEPDSGLPDMKDQDAIQSILVDVRPALDSIHEFKARLFAMPLARKLGNTKFEPLPLFPTNEMIKQVNESVDVWDNIQKQAINNNAKNISNDSSNDGNMIKTELEIHITSEEAKLLSKSFAEVLKQCKEAKQTMENCENDEEYAQASLALSMCMAQIICPLQHKTIVKTIHEVGNNENDSSSNQDAKIDTALENMFLCVAKENEKVANARATFPDLFRR